MHRIWTATLVVTLALLTASCGGGGGSSADTTSATTTLSAAQLRERAEAICADFGERFARVLEGAGSSGPEATAAERRAYGRAIDRGTRIRLDVVSELDALEPPAALRGDYERFVASLRTIARSFPTAAETIARRDPRAAQRDAARRANARLAAELEIAAGCG